MPKIIITSIIITIGIGIPVLVSYLVLAGLGVRLSMFTAMLIGATIDAAMWWFVYPKIFG